jgi:hypothetical protein
MSDKWRSIMFDERRIYAIAIGIGVGLTAIAAGAGSTASTNAPFSCAIVTTSVSGTVALESTVQSDVALDGSYRFRVQSAGRSGSTNFQQGGGFSAMPGSLVALGRIMLGDASAIYDATLEVAADGTTATCTKRIGGRI